MNLYKYFFYAFLIISFTTDESKPQAFDYRLIANFTTDEFKNSAQMWSSLEKETGEILFGNSTALCFFDGVEWSSIHIGGEEVVFSLDKNLEGTVFYGSTNDFGYLVADSVQQMTYVSLLDIVPNHASVFSQVRQTIAHKNHVYFRSLEYVFIYDIIENTIDVMQGEDILDNAYLIQDEILLNVHGSGISKVTENGFELLKGTEALKNDRIYGIFEFNNELIIYSREKGLLQLKDNQLEIIESDVNLLLSEYDGYRFLKLNENRFVIGTLGGGLLIVDNNFDLVDRITTKDGLIDDNVYGLFQDSNNLLWITTDSGISVIDLEPDFLQIEIPDEAGNPLNYFEIGNERYLVTNQLIFRVNSEFELVPILDININNFILDAIPHLQTLISAQINGLWSVGEKIDQISELRFSSLTDLDGKLYGISESRLFEIDSNTREFEEFGLNITISNKINTYQNKLVFNATNGQVFTYDLENNEAIELTSSDNPISGIRRFEVIDDSLYVLSSSNGVFVYNDSQSNLIQKSRLRGNPISTSDVSFFEKCNSEYWISSGRSMVRSVEHDGSFDIKEEWFSGIGYETGIYNIGCGKDYVWFLEEDKMIGVPYDYTHVSDTFQTNISRIFVNRDSLVYGGFGEPNQQPVFKYSDNELRFRFASTYYKSNERNRYSYKLEGFDENWSDFSLETQKDYTNIPEGEYVFKVKSKNVFGVEGSTDSFAFTVLPPWYRTWWAYLLYMIGFSGLMYTAHRIRLNQLLKVERMRTKIASDLHDEVSATLTGISYFAEAVKTDRDEARKSHFINLITESAGDAKEKITDIVWSITPENDDWTLFFSKCRRYASDILESADMEYNLNITDTIHSELSMNVRQHLWMIFKEMLTNAVRHSKATQLDIIFDVDNGVLKLIVQDNGQGFDIDADQMGNGVTNIKKRANAIGAKIYFNSEPEMGTRWRLEYNI